MKNSNLPIPPLPTVLITVLCIITIQLTAQTSSDENYLQYLFPGFTKSIVKIKTGLSYYAVLNYNTVTEKMVFKQDSILLDMANIKAIDTIFLQSRKFVPVNQVFYEVLLNAPISLFIQHKSDLIPPGSPSGYGSTSQTTAIKNFSSLSLNSQTYNLKLPSDFTINPIPVYWIRKDNTMFSFLNKRQFLKIFPGKNNEIEMFIKQNHLKIENRDDLIELVNFCNGVIQ
jgi:hypothetical protein